MSKARDFIEGQMQKGVWVILLGKGGVLDRKFVKDKSGIKAVISRWASVLDVGDMIKIESGESEE